VSDQGRAAHRLLVEALDHAGKKAYIRQVWEFVVRNPSFSRRGSRD
jgi:hypothetical protein